MRTKINCKTLIVTAMLSFSILAAWILLPDGAASADTPLESAIKWAVDTANDDTHGYSQSNRWGPDYDCSSFVISALKAGGIDTGEATSTSTMKVNLMAHGFTWIPWTSGTKASLQRGDILLKESQHSDLYLGDNQIVAAHTDRGNPAAGDQTGTEISVSAYYDMKYDGVLRYTDAVIPVTDNCNCSADYAGTYVVTTAADPLNMRSGHSSTSKLITTIPRLSIVSVSKADGTWAHVSWNGYNGFCNMQFLTKVDKDTHIWDDGKITKSPSASSPGVKTYTCVICGATKDEEIPALNLDKPSKPKLSGTSKGIKISWSAVKNAASYQLYRKVANGSWKKLTTVSAVSYTDTTAAKNGTAYSYKVQACCGSSAGKKSSARKLIFLTVPKLSKLKKLSKTSLKVTYKKNKKAAGYEIMYSRHSDFTKSLTKKVSSAKITARVLSGLHPKQTYYVRVRAYTKAGGKTSRSGWSTAKKKHL